MNSNIFKHGYYTYLLTIFIKEMCWRSTKGTSMQVPSIFNCDSCKWGSNIVYNSVLKLVIVSICEFFDLLYLLRGSMIVSDDVIDVNECVNDPVKCDGE